MKKALCAALAALLSFSASARTWENNIGVGAAVPVSILNTDVAGTDTITQTGFGVEGMYLGIHRNGFAVRGAFSTGLTASGDVAPDGGTSFGGFSQWSIGAGYAFVHGGRLTLAATAGLGMEAAYYLDSDTTTYEGHGGTDVTTLMGLFTVSAGGQPHRHLPHNAPVRHHRQRGGTAPAGRGLFFRLIPVERGRRDSHAGGDGRPARHPRRRRHTAFARRGVDVLAHCHRRPNPLYWHYETCRRLHRHLQR